MSDTNTSKTTVNTASKTTDTNTSTDTPITDDKGINLTSTSNNNNKTTDTNTSTDAPIIDVTGDDLVLTTIDNPYNPKTEYDKWKSFDSDNEHNTEEFVARLVSMEDGFDMDDDMKMNELINKVINEILEHDMTQMYILV